MSRIRVAETIGTALLVYVIVGSGIMGEALADDGAVQLLAHALAVGTGLAVLITVFQTVSGSHFNPSVTLGFWRMGEIDGRTAIAYVIAQVFGAVCGVVLANWSFELPAAAISTNARDGSGLILAETIATFVLVLVILALVRTGRPTYVPAAVGAWVATIVFATSSTGFANPAVTMARMFTDSHTGIAPSSVPGFLAAQILAGLAAARVTATLYPEPLPNTAII